MVHVAIQQRYSEDIVMQILSLSESEMVTGAHTGASVAGINGANSATVGGAIGGGIGLSSAMGAGASGTAALGLTALGAAAGAAVGASFGMGWLVGTWLYDVWTGD